MVYIAILLEYNLSVNEFKELAVSKDAEAVATLLVRLLLLEPGTFQSHPNMGIGIASRYRYGISGEAYRLKTDFKKQIEQYLPQFQSVTIEVAEEKHQFNILAKIDNTMFSLYYNTNTGETGQKVLNISDMTY